MARPATRYQSLYWLTKAADQDVVPALIDLADSLAHPEKRIGR